MHQVSVGDVVIIHEDSQPRGMWHLGCIEKLLPGTDGETRGAVLRVAGRGRRAKFLRRPIQRLYPIEMPAKDKQPVTDCGEASLTDCGTSTSTAAESRLIEPQRPQSSGGDTVIVS